MSESAQQIFQGVVVHAQLAELERTLVPVSVDDLPPPEVIGFRIEGRPQLAVRVLWVSEDRRTAVLIEKCGPCRIIGRHFTEVFYFLTGRCTFRRPDGTEYEVKGGDFACYAEGQAEEATVHETFIKCSMYHSSRPLPYEVTPDQPAQ
jgi:uncharacterized cupin superfamily protein